MIKRRIYQLLLRLHPPAFRERFADEMLWLFDETLGDSGWFGLYRDAAYSLIKQHTADDHVPRSASHLFQGVPEGTLSATRIFQAGVVASIAMIGFMELLKPSVPLPEPPRTLAVRRYVPDFCSGTNLVSRATELHHIRRAHIKR